MAKYHDGGKKGWKGMKKRGWGECIPIFFPIGQKYEYIFSPIDLNLQNYKKRLKILTVNIHPCVCVYNKR